MGFDRAGKAAASSVTQTQRGSPLSAVERVLVIEAVA
jgi:hypothetical protein